MSEKKLSRRGFIGGLGAAAMAGTAISLGIGMKDAEAAAAPNTWDKKTDVVVVGGGLAGLCAAVEASQRKAKVILLDAFTVTGGNSALSTAWFNAADSSIQRKLGIKFCR
jgi:fumarate reductase flavoprotein subunit